ncbi:hypothetical protein AB8880_08330 [Alphaproteobacteria bacterium LSUCC0684]
MKDTFFDRNINFYDWILRKDITTHDVNRNIAIVSTPRSGSTFFCDVINQSQRFGIAAEWFGPKQISAFCTHTGRDFENFDLQEYVDIIYKRSASNGTFSANFHVNHWEFWKKRGVDLLNIGWEKIVFIDRKDKFSQARSLATAEKTGSWRSIDAPIGDDTSTIIDVLGALQRLYRWEKTYITSIKPSVAETFYYDEFTGKNFSESFHRFANTVEEKIEGIIFQKPERLSKQSHMNKNIETGEFVAWLKQINQDS